MNLQKYFMFDGCDTRQEYWGTMILSVVVALALAFGYGVIAALLGTYDNNDIVVTTAIGLLNLWVWIATTVRRLRDADINTWFTLLICVPYVSFIAIIVYGCLPTVNKGE